MLKKRMLFLSCLVGVLLFVFQTAVLAGSPPDWKKDINLPNISSDKYTFEIEYKNIYSDKLQRKFVVEGKEYEDVIIVRQVSNRYTVDSLGNIWESDNSRKNLINLTKNFSIGTSVYEWMLKSLIEGMAKEMADRYPNYEIVSINGKPWQESSYSKLIMDTIEKKIKYANSFLSKHPEHLEIVKNEKYNGLAYEIFTKGRDIEEVLREKGIEVDRNSGGENSDIEENTPDNSTEKNAYNYRIVLKVGQKDIEFTCEETTETNKLTVAPVIKNGTTMIPLRGVFDKCGVQLDYDAETKQVTIKTKDKTIILTLNSNEGVVNGRKIQLSMPAFVENGRTLIPLRFVGKQLGYNVKWIGAEQKIIISY